MFSNKENIYIDIILYRFTSNKYVYFLSIK